MIATSLKHFLDDFKVCYRLIRHERTKSLEETAKILQLPLNEVLKTVLVSENHKPFLAVYPLINPIAQSGLNLLPEALMDQYFWDCEPGSHHPFGEPYGLPVLLDSSIQYADVVYFESGSHSFIIEMQAEEFHYLTSGFSVIALTSALSHEAQATSFSYQK